MTVYTNQARGTYTLGGLPQTTASNAVSAMPATPNFPMVKTQSHDVLLPNTIESYSISGQNRTGLKVPDFLFTDNIPVGLQYVEGSFAVDGVVKTPAIVGNALTYNFGEWAHEATHTFSFQCKRLPEAESVL